MSIRGAQLILASSVVEAVPVHADHADFGTVRHFEFLSQTANVKDSALDRTKADRRRLA